MLAVDSGAAELVAGFGALGRNDAEAAVVATSVLASTGQVVQCRLVQRFDFTQVDHDVGAGSTTEFVERLTQAGGSTGADDTSEGASALVVVCCLALHDHIL